MKFSLLGYLAIGLAASLLLSGFLGWRLAGAGQRCRANMEQAARIAIQDERKRADKADKQAGEIAAQVGQETVEAVATGQGNTNEREVEIRTVVVHGDCRMPVGLPRLDPAVSEANAAASD